MLSFFFMCFLSLTYGYTPIIPPTVGRPWPLPQSERPGTGSIRFKAADFRFVATQHDCKILQEAFKRYGHIMFPEASNGVSEEGISFSEISDSLPSKMLSEKLYSGKPSKTTVELNVTVMTPCEGQRPHLYMDEQYELKICPPEDPTELSLVAQSIWGALRGLETFSQIAVFETSSKTFEIKCTQILDFPRFQHRGLLLDTSRHYLSVSTIKQNLDLMAMNKMNVFHWHIVDDPSFPYQSGVFPDLSALGAWSPLHVYTKDDIASVIDYATDLGIRVVAEFDTPGHVASWGPGNPGFLTPCYSDGTPDGTFGPVDPSKEENFAFLRKLFREISFRFTDRYLHLGGDEVSFNCWRSNPSIQDFMAYLNISGDYTKLEEYYITRLLKIVAFLPSTKRSIVWQEVFDNGVKLDPDTLVHVWKNGNDPNLYMAELKEVTKAGYQALLSSCWYLNYITYGVDWHKFYECDPQDFSGEDAQKKLVLGGEACMWGEWVDDTNIIPRTWPRASPVAERLWSYRNATTSADEAAPRLEEHRCRLLRRGYPAEPLGPSYCPGII